MSGARARWRPTRASIIVLVVGLALSLAFAVISHRIQTQNERRLLGQRVNEGAAALEAAVPNVTLPLRLLATTRAIGQRGDGDALDRLVRKQLVDEGGRFTSLSAWPVGGDEPVFVAGDDPALAERPRAEVAPYFDEAPGPDTVAVVDLLDEDPPRLGYLAFAPDGEGSFVVYGEQELEGDRTSIDRDERAFDGMEYAVYLGTSEDRDELVLASTPDLPLDGRRATQRVPFGDTSLLLVVTPQEPLSGTVLARLPLYGLLAGTVVSIAAAIMTDRLQRRRERAEWLAAENARLYAQQRESSHELQRSLLPKELPELPGLEVEVRYQAGTHDTDVGGDWYDVVRVGDRLAVIVGDVSGRGLGAAAVMASVRFTMRALAMEGHPPSEVAAHANAILNADNPTGHFATAVCAVVDPVERTLTYTSAGHPRPLVLEEGHAAFADGEVGPPIGVMAVSTYPSATVPLPSEATALFVTDGLYERRGETVDVGLERLRAAASTSASTVGEQVDSIIGELTGGNPNDDTVILALRWST